MIKVNLNSTVALMKAEIRRDIANGTIPQTVASFSELHDYVDANCYGGFCDDNFAEQMIQHFGGRDEHEGMPQEMIDYMNAAQDMISEWLRHASSAELFTIEEDKLYHVQTKTTPQQNWVGSITTLNLQVAVEHAAYEREHNKLARVVMSRVAVLSQQ